MHDGLRYRDIPRNLVLVSTPSYRKQKIMSTRTVTSDSHWDTIIAVGSDMPIFETYTVRSIWEGEKLTEQTGLDYEAAADAFESEEKFYLNLPDSHRAQGTTVQMFRKSDSAVIREFTIA